MCSLEAIEGTVSKVLGLRVLGSTPVSGSGVYWGLRFTADGFRSDKQEPGACGFRLNSTKKALNDPTWVPGKRAIETQKLHSERELRLKRKFIISRPDQMPRFERSHPLAVKLRADLGVSEN